MEHKKKVAVIGASFSGLSAAAYLANAGFKVDVYEKHGRPGGRVRQFPAAGYTFDMGPSWYWMPGVFERFFQDLGSCVSDWYRLRVLDPAFEIVFDGGETIQVPDDFKALCGLFDAREPGTGRRLEKLMRVAQYKYECTITDEVNHPLHCPPEALRPGQLFSALRSPLLSSFGWNIRNEFHHPHLVALMEFPVLFLGAVPGNAPALYTLTNYSGLKLGTWYPEGGFGAVARAIAGLAERKGARIHYHKAVRRTVIRRGQVTGVEVDGKVVSYDGVVAAGDYRRLEEMFLPEQYRTYSRAYRERRTFAPSCLVYYVGLRKTFPALGHHTLFFEEKPGIRATDNCKTADAPPKPQFYLCRPTATDPTVAPEGHDNFFLLMPVAPGITDSSLTRETYFDSMADRIMNHIGEDIRPSIEYKRCHGVDDFVQDFGVFMGNTYGLGNTLSQTAVFRTIVRNRKLPNLVYSGQLTMPGPGVPPALISGKLAAGVLAQHLNNGK